MPRLVYLGKPDSNGRSALLNKNSNNEDIDLQSPLPENMNSEISEIFPENENILAKHPEYVQDIGFVILDECKIKLSFLSEGAGYLNSWGYFIYDAASPPVSESDINDLVLVFPNASRDGSGGKMKKGDTIELAYEYNVSVESGLNIATPTNLKFPAGKAIAFFIYIGGWNTTFKKVTGTRKFFSLSGLNTLETGANKHHFMAVDSSKSDSAIYITVEDVLMDSSDKDFNDVVVVATVDPIDSIRYDSYIHRIIANNPPSDFIYGYKKVFFNNPDLWSVSEAVATLRIPKNADIRDNHHFCTQKKRTNKAYVESIIIVPNTADEKVIWNLNPSPKVGKFCRAAHSHFNVHFVYRHQNWVESSISDDLSTHDWLEGIHFFATWDEAKNYNPRLV